MTTLILIGIAILLLAVFLWSWIKPRVHPKKQLKSDLFGDSRKHNLNHLSHNKSDDHNQTWDLPTSYGSDRFVLLARDPDLLFSYWEITSAKWEEFSSNYKPATWDPAKSVLRLYDLSGTKTHANNPLRYYDYLVDVHTEQMHIKTPDPGRTYCAEIGQRLPDGSFIPLLRSNEVIAPSATLSEQIDQEWMCLDSIYRHLQFHPGISSYINEKDRQNTEN